MRKAVVLLSGGIDSSTLLAFVRQRRRVPWVVALSFRYGQKHDRELIMARRQAAAQEDDDHREVDLRSFGSLTRGLSALTDGDVPVPDLADVSEAARRQPPTYVPNRNMLLLALAAACAESVGAQAVFYGAQVQDEYGYWDCTRAFVERMNAVLSLNRGAPVSIHAPFVGMRKADVVRLGCELGVSFADTWTCYRGGEAPCGTCPSCVERQAAFREAGIEDPLWPGGT